MNKIRKLVGLAAALAFAMVMLPAAAFADTTQYDLFVNGEQFTSEKLTIECGRLWRHQFEADRRSDHYAPRKQLHHL